MEPAESDKLLDRILSCIRKNDQVQFAIRNAETLQDILDILARQGLMLRQTDVVAIYRELDQAYFPWFAMPMQKRREFIHRGRFLD